MTGGESQKVQDWLYESQNHVYNSIKTAKIRRVSTNQSMEGVIKEILA
jgi:hypothetical protein